MQLAVTVNGVSTPTIPQSRDYKISITCDNGATGTWDYVEWGPNIRNVTTSKVKCSMDFVNFQGLCKRATELHTETCSQTSSYCSADGYAEGDTITYGSLGTSGTLTTGDAFDCDVNGDGTYNSTTERFYYVTDVDTNTAVLIYYNDVSGGIANNTTGFAYDSSGSKSNGPITAIKQLPTTSRWSNVSLTNTTRNITNIAGTTLVTGFSYSGYAARLLTYQEVESGCYDGITSMTSIRSLSINCQFLLENSRYSSSSLKSGYWLETPSSSSKEYVSWIEAYSARVDIEGTPSLTNFGVRPAIEVLKSNILY